jgi:hypothetical protein
MLQRARKALDTIYERRSKKDAEPNIAEVIGRGRASASGAPMLSLALQTPDDGRARGANGRKQSADQSDGQGER